MSVVDDRHEVVDGADEPSPLARRVVFWSFMLILLFGFAGFELWPVTAFRMYSLEHHTTQVALGVATIDASGRETRLDPRDLDIGSRWLVWPLEEFEDGSAAHRQRLCNGIATAARRLGREVDAVRVYRVIRRLERVGGEWEIAEDPVLLGACPVAP